MHGIDWNGPIAIDDDTESVVVPRTHCPLLESALNDLQQTINPLIQDGSFGIHTYQAVVQYIVSHV